ncbi:hypothetical protein Tco_0270851 [Tanacetum coccineum]
MDTRSRRGLQADEKTYCGTPNTYRSWIVRSYHYTWLCSKGAISAGINDGDSEGRQIPVQVKRLKRYFQAHTVVVITNQPIKQCCTSSEISGKNADVESFRGELEGYDINTDQGPHQRANMADFIVERTGRNLEFSGRTYGKNRRSPDRQKNGYLKKLEAKMLSQTGSQSRYTALYRPRVSHGPHT